MSFCLIYFFTLYFNYSIIMMKYISQKSNILVIKIKINVFFTQLLILNQMLIGHISTSHMMWLTSWHACIIKNTTWLRWHGIKNKNNVFFPSSLPLVKGTQHFTILLFLQLIFKSTKLKGKYLYDVME